jgi:DNA invertase Pin-like site-specific DNA recombinase
MNIHAYARLQTPEQRAGFQHAVRALAAKLDVSANGGKVTYRFDGLAGQRGLNATLDAARSGDDNVVVFNHASDAGRDLRECVRNLNELMLLQPVRAIRILDSRTDLTLTPDGLNGAWRLLSALWEAHSAYVSMNNKLGVEAARLAGAQIGRRPVTTLERVQETISEMMNASAGQLPSARKLAAKVGVSVGKAHALLKEFALSQKVSDMVTSKIADEKRFGGVLQS